MCNFWSVEIRFDGETCPEGLRSCFCFFITRRSAETSNYVKKFSNIDERVLGKTGDKFNVSGERENERVSLLLLLLFSSSLLNLVETSINEGKFSVDRWLNKKSLNLCSRSSRGERVKKTIKIFHFCVISSAFCVFIMFLVPFFLHFVKAPTSSSNQNKKINKFNLFIYAIISIIRSFMGLISPGLRRLQKNKEFFIFLKLSHK